MKVLIVLGLNHGEINSTASISIDGKIVCGTPEERITRNKKTKLFPQNAVKFCLDFIDKKLEDCDYIAQGWNPGENWQKYNPLFSTYRTKREDYFYTVADNLYNFVDRSPPEWVLMQQSEKNKMPPIYFVRHHLAHAANAFFLSPFKEAAILTCDWRGEFQTTSLGIGKENEIEIFSTKELPHSLGMFYATYTQLLGYRDGYDEWKVMALSAFDVDCTEHLEKIRKTIKLTSDGLFELDQSYYQGVILDKPKLYTDKLVNLLGGREGIKGEEPDEWYFSVAKAMQTVSEEIALHMIETLYKKTNNENLALSGGFFMNSVLNGKILDKTQFKNLYISFDPTDAGNSIGSALYVSHCVHGEKRDYSSTSSYLGKEYTENEITDALDRRKIKSEKLENVSLTTAKLLSEGKIVARFDGRMEFGERALGNRSILADPRIPEMKNKINAIIKYRESYRPFAPSIIEEKASKFFNVPEKFQCKYMEKVVPVKSEFRSKLPSITHVDGSARVHTVNIQDNKNFYNILIEMEKLTGFPIVLNTSFNINGEPIVMSPNDALNTFFNSGLEYLILGNQLVTK